MSSAKLLGVGFAGEYELHFNKRSNIDGSGKCSISPGDRGVHLAIYEIATSQQDTLDCIEGLGNGYNTLIIEDPTFGECLSYIAEPAAIDETLKPIDWYKEIVILGCRWNRFPDEYIQTIENTGSISDPDQERSRERWELVEELRRAT